MSQISLEKLEERVSALEREMAGWLHGRPPSVAAWKDWRQAIGTFVPSELSEEVDKAGREYREADRRAEDNP